MSRFDFKAQMLAPCGINCTVCYRHLGKNPCAGCSSYDSAKPETCRKCAIKACAAEKGISHCGVCDSFPCKPMKMLDKSYHKRYAVSLIENCLTVKEYGVEDFMTAQRSTYTCPACGGLISLHDGDCSNCEAKYPLGRRLTDK